MSEATTHAVTGAFGYSGQHIARKLLESGRRVVTLTSSSHRPDPFGGSVPALPLAFEDPGKLSRSLEGVSVLHNTYWVRFNHRAFTHAQAVKNTLTLFRAAAEAGVRRIVHVSITNPSEESPLEYFRGKAVLEQALRKSGLSHAILRPAVLFGAEDILINNIAWTLRRLPVFGVFGDGRYRIRPIHVDDLAALAVALGEVEENTTIDAVGPESFSFRDLVSEIGKAIGRNRPVVSVPPAVGLAVGRLLGRLVGDVMITRDEIEGLMAGLLDVDAPPAGPTRLSQWAREHAHSLGTLYASELARRRT